MNKTFISRLWIYVLVGLYFGFVLTRAEVVSWWRIQEMFRFQSFHMYGIIGSAILTAAASIFLIRKMGIKTISGDEISVPPKELGTGTRYWVGGTVFGLGWALAGACPGPMFALVGNGVPVMIVSILAAVLGTWMYGTLRIRLPH